MARSSLLTASWRRNLLRWASQVDGALDTSTGHSHNGTDSKSLTASGNTLDQSYDQGGAGLGRAITVNDGAVTMSKTDTGTENVLEINATPSAGAAGAGILVTNGGNSTGAGISFANTGSGADILGTGSLWSVSKAGVGVLVSLSSGAISLTEGTAPAGTVCYAVRDNTGDVTVNALTGKEVHIAIAGTDVLDVGTGVEVISGGLTVTAGGLTVVTGGATITGTTTVTGAVNITGTTTVTGNLSVSGSLTFGGNWTVGATLTVDELILDTDGVAPAATNAYVVSDNTGDLTLNALTGKTINLAIAGTDEVTLSATVLDLNANAIDNAGFLILNAATAPAGTEVYLVNDNTGDLTANALTGKSFIVAVAGADEYTFGAAALALAANNLTLSTGYIQFSGAGYVDLGATGYLVAGTAGDATGKVRLANNTWISAENAAGNANINMISVDASNLVAFGVNLAAASITGALTLLSDIDLSTSGTGTYDLILKDAVADALSIRRAGTDMVVFDSTTPLITITPATTVTGLVTANGGVTLGANQNLTVSGSPDLVIAANTAAALEIKDGTTALAGFDSRNTVSNITALLVTSPASQTLPNAAIAWHRAFGVAAYTATLAGVTQVTTAMDGMVAHFGIPTVNQSGGAVTVDKASAIFISAVAQGANVTITDKRMIDTSVAGCYLTNAGVWTDASSEAHKTNIREVDNKGMAARLAEVKVKTYQRRDTSDGGYERYGLIAEEAPDFLRSIDGLGIAPGYVAGFALAGVKYLEAKVKELEAEIVALRA